MTQEIERTWNRIGLVSFANLAIIPICAFQSRPFWGWVLCGGSIGCVAVMAGLWMRLGRQSVG